MSVVRSAEVAVAALRDILTREPELIAELGWWRVGGVNNVWNEDLSVNVVFYALANRLKDSRTAFAPPVPVREGERSDG